MNDVLLDGRRFRTFNVLEDFSREALTVKIDTNIPFLRIIRVLEQIAFSRGYPDKVRMDDGPEFVSAALAEWADEHAVHLDFIEAGGRHRIPTSNASTAAIATRCYRYEVLDMYLFRPPRRCE
jgi:putative transposase